MKPRLRAAAFRPAPSRDFKTLLLVCKLLLRREARTMRSSLGNLAPGFAAMVVLFAPAVDAQPQGSPSAPAARPAPSPEPHVAPAAARPALSSGRVSRKSPITGSPSPRSSTLGETSAPPSGTRGESRMRERRTYGSERGASSNERPYRDRNRETVHLPVYYPSSLRLPPPAPEPPVTHMTGGDAVAEGPEAQLRATEHEEPPNLSLCPPPYRMTARDGCQK